MRVGADPPSSADSRRDLSAIGLTARALAAARARESRRPDALFVDPLAARFAGEEGQDLLAHNSAGLSRRVAIPFVEVRTRYFDDWLLAAAGPIRQLVILAAGFDARAWRLPLPADTVVYEVDRRDVLDLKAHLARDIGARLERRPVGADLLRDDWPSALRAGGFDPARPSAWIAEGLLLYFEEVQVHQFLERIAALSAAGSIIAADVDDVTFGTSPLTRTFVRKLRSDGTPWRFGTGRPETLFAHHGFSAEVRMPGERGAGYGRWPLPVLPRRLPFWPRTYMVTGRRVA